MGAWTFNYDTLNRLAGSAGTQTGNPSTNYCWSYDGFGNRTQQSGSSAAFQSGSGGPSPCQPQSGATFVNTWAQYNGTANGTNNNQVSASSQNANQASGYDVAGDVTSDGTNQYLYDAEGRICAVLSNPVPSMTVMTGYVYNADGERVAKGTISSWSCDPSTNGFQTISDFVLGPGGEQMTEMGMDSNGSLAWQHTNVFAAGQLIATYDPDGLHFYLNDPLGTRRAQTDYAGQLEQTCSSSPFGDSLGCTGSTTSPTEHHFTGKERDTESGNDYFGARYYASSMGRWMSPDWSAKAEPVPYAKLDNPQSLNLYAYLNNNPLRAADLDGHDDYDGKVHVTSNADGTKTATQGTQTTSTSQTKDAHGNVTSTTTSTTKTMNTVQLNADGKVTSATATSTTASQTVDSKGAMTGSTNQTSTSTLAENSSQVTSLQQAAQTWTQRTLAGDALNNIPGSGAVPFMSTITKLLNATGTTVSDLLKNDPGPGNAACSKGGVDCF